MTQIAVFIFSIGWLSLVASSAQAVGHTFRCRDVFGPLTPIGDIRSWKDAGELWEMLELRSEPFGAPKFVAYYSGQAGGSPFPYGGGAGDITLFHFQDVIDDVQEALKLENESIKEHMRNLFKWMSELTMAGIVSTTKKSSLDHFAECFKMLYGITPSFQSLTKARTSGLLPLEYNQGTMHEKVFAAARLQMMVKHCQLLLKWRDLLQDPDKRKIEHALKVNAYLQKMEKRGYTADQAWWALQVAATAGRS